MWRYLKCIWLTVCITSAGLLMFINDALHAVTELIILSCFFFFIPVSKDSLNEHVHLAGQFKKITAFCPVRNIKECVADIFEYA
jgi:hypothetical protein